MPEEEKKEETSEVKETEDGGIEVDLKEEEVTAEAKEESKEEEEKKPVKEQDPFKNKVYAQDRIIAKLQREIEELRSTKAPPAREPEPEPDVDEIDKLAQHDWKAAVRKLAQDEARRLQNAEAQRLEEAKNSEMTAQRLSHNTQTVLERHPELDDATSEKFQVFQDILNKNPDWRMSPDGPLLTMYEMENALRSKGFDVDGTIRKKVEAETSRIARTNATSLPSSRSTTMSSKVVLTKDQRDFCDQNGVSYEEYARTLRKSGDKMGVEI